MTTMTRVRGDNYPLTATITLDDTAFDITDSLVKFSYKNESNEVKTIVGLPTNTVGGVSFIPTATDFLVTGVFSFDIQRITDAYTYTHVKGTLIIDGDVTL